MTRRAATGFLLSFLVLATACSWSGTGLRQRVVTTMIETLFCLESGSALTQSESRPAPVETAGALPATETADMPAAVTVPEPPVLTVPVKCTKSRRAAVQVAVNTLPTAAEAPSHEAVAAQKCKATVASAVLSDEITAIAYVVAGPQKPGTGCRETSL